jgi:hypothetical protein
MSRRRLPYELPAPKAYSDSPGAVRMRRYLERKRQAELEQPQPAGGPPTTTFHCICGWRWTGLGTLRATEGAFALHAKSCLFGEPIRVIVRKRARVSP